MAMADEAQLEAVFELCGPRKKDRKISLRKLEGLFEEHTNSKEMCHQFLSLEQEAENDNDRDDRTLDNSNGALEDSNNGEEGGGGDSWISFDQFRRSFSSEFSQQPQDISNQNEETAMNRRNSNLLCIDEEEASAPTTPAAATGNEESTAPPNWLLDEPLIRPSNESSPIKPRPAAAVAVTVPKSPLFPEKSGSLFLKTQSEPSLLLGDTSHRTHHPDAGNNIFDLYDNLAASNLSTDRHSSSSGGTMMNESPSHNAAAAVTTRFPEKPSSNSESPSSLVDSAIGGSASPDLMQVKSQCSSLSDRDEEVFDGHGEIDDGSGYYDDSEIADFDSSSRQSPSSARRTERSSPLPPSSSSNLVRRNSWLRTSLRRASAGSKADQLAPRRWGSFRQSPNKRVSSSSAHASALLFSSSAGAAALAAPGSGGTAGGFAPSGRSSGRSSNCDEHEMQSDVSIEEDLNELNQKVHSLQQQVRDLADKQEDTNDKYSKVKQDNSTLSEQIHMLEENLRELQVSSADALATEQRRSKDLIARLEREKELETENFAFRTQHLEKENAVLQEEAAGLRAQIERLKTEKQTVEDFLMDAQQAASTSGEETKRLMEARRREQERWEEERAQSKHIVQEMEAELMALRQSSSQSNGNGNGHQVEEDAAYSTSVEALMSRLSEMEEQVRQLNEANRTLGKRNEDLECEVLNKRVEQGRALVAADENGGNVSLGDEMSDTQIRKALKEQRDVNLQLRSYIDGILMNIIEQHPELLEVRRK